MDWNSVVYDLKGVDWSSVFATPTPQPAPQPPAQASKPAVTPKPAPPAYTPAPKPPKETEAPKPPKPSGGHGNIESMIEGAKHVFQRLNVDGYENAKNLKVPTGDAWIDTDGSAQWATEFINESGDDVMVTCWPVAGYTGLTINKNQPPIGVLLPANGGTVNVGFAPNTGMACAPVYPNTVLGFFGGVLDTLFEVTFGQWGTFDISREVHLGGHSISAKGSKCTSDMETCVFKCENGADTCTTGYSLLNCGTAQGGGTGEYAGAASGGCSMSPNGEKVKVTFS